MAGSVGLPGRLAFSLSYLCHLCKREAGGGEGEGGDGEREADNTFLPGKQF